MFDDASMTGSLGQKAYIKHSWHSLNLNCFEIIDTLQFFDVLIKTDPSHGPIKNSQSLQSSMKI